MRSPAQILELLQELAVRPADDLEDQDLDFKEWNTRSRDDAVSLVVEMAVCMANVEVHRGYLERGGSGTGTYWTLRPDLHRRLAGQGHPEKNRRLEFEAAKARVHSVLLQRQKRGEGGLTNAEVRAFTHLDRQQVLRLLRELKEEGLVDIVGRGRGARFLLRSGRL